MKKPKQAAHEAKKLFRLCLVRGRLDEDRARGVVETVLSARRRGYLAVLRHFERLLRLESARYTACIESAVPVPKDLESTLRTELEDAYGPGIATVFTENPRLIGGMRIRIGSDVYDGTVYFGLATLQKSFGITSTNGTR